MGRRQYGGDAALGRKRQVSVECPYCEAVCWIDVSNINGDSEVVECHDEACAGQFLMQTAVKVTARALPVPDLAPKQGPFAA